MITIVDCCSSRYQGQPILAAEVYFVPVAELLVVRHARRRRRGLIVGVSISTIIITRLQTTLCIEPWPIVIKIARSKSLVLHVPPIIMGPTLEPASRGHVDPLPYLVYPGGALYECEGRAWSLSESQLRTEAFGNV